MKKLRARQFKKLADLVLAINSLAREFYSHHGCKVSDDFMFYNAHHPTERLMWRLALEAYKHIYPDADIEEMAELGIEQLESEEEE